MVTGKRARGWQRSFIEPLEDRRLLSCMVGTTASNIPNIANIPASTVIVVASPLQLSNGTFVPPGSYTAAQIQQLQAISPTSGLASGTHLTISSDSDSLTIGQTSLNLSATATASDDSPVPSGTVTFYTAPPVYDRSGNVSVPCFDEAHKSKTRVGSADLADGPAGVSVSDLPVGVNWVWAEYNDGSATPAVSAYVELTSRQPIALHLEGLTSANSAKLGVTLSNLSGAPLLGSSFATPAAGTAQASVNVDASIPFAAAPWQGPAPLFRTPCIAGTTSSGYSSGLVSSFTASTGSISKISGNTWTHSTYSVPVPSGHLSFSIDGQNQATASFDSTGAAFLPCVALTPGHHSITVSYLGDAVFSAPDQTFELDIAPTPTVVTLTASNSSVSQGHTLHLQIGIAGASADYGSLTGTFSILDNGQTLTTCTLAQAQQLSLALSAGEHQLTAVYSGDALYAAGQSAAVNVRVLTPALPQLDSAGTHFLLTSSATQWLAGQDQLRLTAAIEDNDGSPVDTGVITFYATRPAYDCNAYSGEHRACFDYASTSSSRTNLGSVKVIGGLAELQVQQLPAGESWVWAEYSGSAAVSTSLSTYASVSTSIAAALHVEHAGPYRVNQSPTIAVTLTNPSGSPLYGSDFAKPAGQIQQASARLNLQLAQPVLPTIPTTSTLGGTTDWWYGNGTIGVITACVGYPVDWSSAHATYTAPQPQGLVTFSERGAVLGTSPIDGTGRASFQPGKLTAGHHVITVSYAGSEGFAPSTSRTIQFDIAPRTPLKLAITPSSTRVLQGKPLSFTITATGRKSDTVAPTGTVSILCDGRQISRLKLDGTATTRKIILPAGTHRFQAIYLDDGIYARATSVVTRVTVLSNPKVRVFSSLLPQSARLLA